MYQVIYLHQRMGNNDMVTLGNELILTGIEFQKDVVIQQMITAAITIIRKKIFNSFKSIASRIMDILQKCLYISLEVNR